MNQHVSIPGWDDFSVQLKEDLNYSETMLERTFYTYRSFVQKFCPAEEDDAAEKVKKGIDNVSTAYQKNDISKDQLLRMRRLAYRLLMYMDTGKISWKRAPLYGKKFGNDHNEALLGRFLEDARDRYAESILRRDESTVRQFILYCESVKSKDVEQMGVMDLIDFLGWLKKRRPAGLKAAASTMRHFYLFLTKQGLVPNNLLAALKPWDTPHKKAYGTFSTQEKEKILGAIDRNSPAGKRDYAIFSLAIDCVIRSSDICSLKLEDINWKGQCISIVQKKTRIPVTLPFSRRSGDAIADYILNARGSSPLPYVFLKFSFSDSGMTSSLLCARLKKCMKNAGINREPHERINMHTFRRSLGTDMADSGSTLEMIGQVLGHSCPSSAKAYLSFSERSLKECAPDTELFPESREVCDD